MLQLWDKKVYETFSALRSERRLFLLYNLSTRVACNIHRARKRMPFNPDSFLNLDPFNDELYSSPSSPSMLLGLSAHAPQTDAVAPSPPSSPPAVAASPPSLLVESLVEAQATPLVISPCNMPLIDALQNVFEDDETRFELSAAPDDGHPLGLIPFGRTAMINKRLYEVILDATDKGRVSKGKKPLKPMDFKGVQRRMNQVGLTLRTLNVHGEDQYSIAFYRKAWEKKRWALGNRPGGKRKCLTGHEAHRVKVRRLRTGAKACE